MVIVRIAALLIASILTSCAEEPKISANDRSQLATLDSLSGAWNETIAPVVSSYLDPNVSADDWVRDSTRPISEIRGIYMGIYAATLSVADDSLRNLLLPCCQNYFEQVQGLTALHLAVASHDTLGETESLAALGGTAERGQALSLIMMDKLRPYVGTDASTREAQRQAKEPRVSANDKAVIQTFADRSAVWNRTVAPIVAGYLNPNVSADDWVRDATRPIAELRAIHTEMYSAALSVSDVELGGILLECVQNYRDKIDALTALHIAVANHDIPGSVANSEALSAAGRRGQELSIALIDRIRPFVDPDEFAREAEKQGKEAATLIRTTSSQKRLPYAGKNSTD